MVQLERQEEQGPNSEKISLESLSQLTGFPVEFIQSELLIGEDDLGLEELRASVLNYLQENFPDRNDE